jgi:F0F1-type ATP synthase membrane subunit c/vacuolar-type H+-ATPase subunit K
MLDRFTTILTRLRVALGFVFGAAVLWLARPTKSTLIVGALIACSGEALRFWAAGHLRKSREVTTSGPYRWFAHPLYVGSSVMGAGLAIACGRLMVAVLIALYVGVLLTMAARSEEAFLRRTFGDQYDRYRRAGGGRGGDVEGRQDSESGPRRFSWGQALANHEHRALVGLIVAVLLLALKAAYNV